MGQIWMEITRGSGSVLGGNQHLQLLDKKQLAKRIGVSVRTIENLVKAGEFPAGVRIGRFVYWTDKIITVWQRQLFAAQDNWQP